MATTLDKPLKREIEVAGKPYMLTIAPAGLKLVPKGQAQGPRTHLGGARQRRSRARRRAQCFAPALRSALQR
jgi:hypothetical protein